MSVLPITFSPAFSYSLVTPLNQFEVTWSTYIHKFTRSGHKNKGEKITNQFDDAVKPSPIEIITRKGVFIELKYRRYVGSNESSARNLLSVVDRNQGATYA